MLSSWFYIPSVPILEAPTITGVFLSVFYVLKNVTAGTQKSLTGTAKTAKTPRWTRAEPEIMAGRSHY